VKPLTAYFSFCFLNGFTIHQKTNPYIFERNVEMEMNIPKIKMPLVSQESFQHATDVLKRCTADHIIDGVNRPFVAPGGAYGSTMWSLDGALAVEGYQWLNPEIGKDLLYNLKQLSTPNGRVKLYTPDKFGHIPNVQEEIGSLPKFFEALYDAAKRDGTPEFTEEVYILFTKNLNWWFSHRQDPETKLITAVFEETFIPNTFGGSMEYAPIDTNMEIAAGCYYTALLAQRQGLAKEAAFYFNKKAEILSAVNQCLWDSERRAYYGWFIEKKRFDDRLMASTFYGLRFNNANTEQKRYLFELLLDTDSFNWNTYPLTSVSKKDKIFTVIDGAYAGNPCWSGSVWMLINFAVIQALNESNERDLAAELTYKTLNIFNNNYAEFLHPYNGSGHGVSEYAWTASLFIKLIIEEIFGIDYNAFTRQITIRPNLPEALKNSCFSIENLFLPNQKRLDVRIVNSAVAYSYKGNNMGIIL